MGKKVVLPKKVAEAIKSLENAELTWLGIFHEITKPKSMGFCNESVPVAQELQLLRDYSFKKESNYGDDIVVALVTNEYKIEPEYVSFEEAMKAIKKGKEVAFHNGYDKIRIGIKGSMGWTRDYTWKSLIEGKWAIEGGEEE